MGNASLSHPRDPKSPIARIAWPLIVLSSLGVTIGAFQASMLLSTFFSIKTFGERHITHEDVWIYAWVGFTWFLSLITLVASIAFLRRRAWSRNALRVILAIVAGAALSAIMTGLLNSENLPSRSESEGQWLVARVAQATDLTISAIVCVFSIWTLLVLNTVRVRKELR